MLSINPVRIEMNTLISVVIPVYNVEKYLRQCLDSVISQSYRNLEILLVDDGSTDGSGDICDEYKDRDERIQVFHLENKGLSAARNYAIDRAHGTYIAFIDSDDWFELNAVQHLLDTAEATNADIVTCRYYLEYINKTEVSVGGEEAFVVSGPKVMEMLVLQQKVTGDAWNKLYKKSIFADVRYPEGRVFEDIATTYKLFLLSKSLAYTPDCLLHYRNRKNSISNNHSMKSLIDYWVAYRERFLSLKDISEEYHRMVLAEAVGAVSRTWRWYAGCAKQDKKGSKVWLDEMQRFVKAYRKEILGNRTFSRHVRMTCRYAMFQNRILFRVLYILNNTYRCINRNKYFEE